MAELFLAFSLLFTSITQSEPVIVTLNASYQPVDRVYAGTTGEIITISARSISDEPIDVTLEVLLNDERLAFNDDQHTNDTALGERDAVIERLTLPSDGDYIIRVNSFSGAQSGDVEITVRAALPSCEPPLWIAELRENESFSCSLTVEDESEITVSARDVSGTLDPVVTVYANDERIAANDDHDSANAALDMLDAEVSFEAAINPILVVSDFSGAAGTVELRIEIAP